LHAFIASRSLVCVLNKCEINHCKIPYVQKTKKSRRRRTSGIREKEKILRRKGVYTFIYFTVISLYKNSANIFNLGFKTLEAKSHLISYDEQFKMLCERQYNINIVLDVDKRNCSY